MQETQLNTIGARLKNETMAAHLSLESHARLKPLGEGELTMSAYGEVLQRFLPFWEAIEAAAYRRADIAEILPDIQERFLSSKLSDDLSALKMPRLTVAAPQIDWIKDLPSAIGSIYVLEGSTLGGRVIIKRVMDQLGLTADHGASYYAGYGAETGTKWKAFQQAIHAYPWDDHAADTIIQAANQTFSALEKWMDVESTQPMAA